MNGTHTGKVLHVIDSLNMGGAETWLVEMLRYAHQHDTGLPPFDFLVAGGQRGVFDDEVTALGSKIHYLPLRQGTTAAFSRGFREILRRERYSAIHDHQDYLAGWHFLFGAGQLPPVRAAHVHNPYYQLHNNYGVTRARRMKLRIGRFLLRRFATHIFGTSARILKEYGITSSTFPGQYVGPMHCAFDVSRYAGDHAFNKKDVLSEMGWPEDTRLVLFAGRLDVSTRIGHPNNHKNSAFALEVIRACAGYDTRMIMAGANDFILPEFNELIAEKGLSDRVKLLGVRKDMVRLMLAADVLLFPSRAEGMGMVAIEAQAAGLPVLASSAVPDEVTVLKELVDFCSLDAPFPEWATRLERMARERRPGGTVSDPRWLSSPFNLPVCCTLLAGVYAGRGVHKTTAA
jgi:glycosyltransferase involved in cell wall biosynthesis